ncbi:MAG: translation initiation factor IF-2 [Candidatus Bathyarchaeota archaeon]|nr:translation initiation factor IF-2 [Candidatus Bathyarchaeota archaeon]MDH5689284.1 translation initiation factor IF-2 [Candidatus Bathyarchaeota archaeon]
MPIRQPIVCILGHVDTGKTLLLDKIRKSNVQAREVGGITQHIGASFFPVEVLDRISGPLLEKFGGKIRVPGLLIVDTPGHESFANLRRRGGAVADIAILVIDILRGFEAQTYECIDILNSRRTPFLVAANKIDRIPGWRPNPDGSFLDSYKKQDPVVQQYLDEHLYIIMGRFSELSFRADRFDRIKDFTRTAAIVPTSAKTGEGIPELVTILTGLTQQYLQERLETTEGPAKGTVLEVKEETGLGVTINVIIYDGILRRGDTVVVGGRTKPIVTNTRAVLLPKPLDEIRDPRDKFSSVNEVSAAAGVKVAAPDLDEALAGAPLFVVPSEDKIDEYVEIVSEEVERLKITKDIDGVILKTDALGSLEAIAESLNRSKIPIRLADVGDVSKRDVTEAMIVKDKEPLYGAVLAFNVKVLPDAEEEANTRKIPIFRHNVIYHLTDDYLRWMTEQREALIKREFDRLVKPAKIKVLPGYVFRRARPAIVGIEVLAGKIKPRIRLTTEDGKEIGEIQQIQDRGETMSEAEVGNQVAISIDKATVGRHFNEGDILHVGVPEEHAKILNTKYQDRLTPDEAEALRELVTLMRKSSPFWAA